MDGFWTPYISLLFTLDYNSLTLALLFLWSDPSSSTDFRVNFVLSFFATIK